MTQKFLTLSQPSRLIAVGLIVPLLLFFVWMIRGLLAALVLASLFAIVLKPMEARLASAFGKRKAFSPPVIVFLAIAIFFAPLSIIAVMAARSIATLLANIRLMPREDLLGFVQRGYGYIDGVLGRVGVTLPHEDINTALTDIGQNLLGYLGDIASSVARSTPAFMLSMFVFLMALFFLLRDGERLVSWIATLLPFSPKDTAALFVSVRESVRNVMLGSLLVGLVQASLVLILLLVFAIPGPLVLFTLALILSLVPVVGTTPVTGGALIYLLVHGRPVAAVLMIVGMIVVGLSDNIIRPIVHARSGNMHPLLSLISIFGGLQAFGAAGVFMGPVLAALAVWAIELYARSKNSETIAVVKDSPSPTPTGNI
ncbi:MAG: AI-2E family transporter [Deltaproteobacteria bacterium]|nr:AI-2E family transporter [Deltaproteobacteria bacterium]